MLITCLGDFFFEGEYCEEHPERIHPVRNLLEFLLKNERVEPMRRLVATSDDSSPTLGAYVDVVLHGGRREPISLRIVL